MKLDELDANTGLPLVQETRSGDRWRSLPRWVQAQVIEAEKGKTWLPAYLQWDGPTLASLKCWKCATPIVGWRVVLDKYGNLVEKAGKQCLWLRSYDNYASTPVTVRWGCLNRLAIFDALHCKDCVLEAADLQMLVSIFLAGHATLMEYGWEHHLPLPMGKHGFATYLYRWSDDPAIRCEPLGLNYKTKEAAMNLPTPGKPMMPADYVQIGEAVQAGKFWPGMIVEYDPTRDIPPGWKPGPREGTIQKL